MSNPVLPIQLPIVDSKEWQHLNTSFKNIQKLFDETTLTASSSQKFSNIKNLEVLIQQFFPSYLNTEIYFSNISLRRSSKLSELRVFIRVKDITPHLEELLPESLSLGFIGAIIPDPLFCNRLELRDIIPISHSDPRDFEVSVSVTCYSDRELPKENLEPLLNAEFIGGLPFISLETEENIGKWREYIDWKKKLLKEKSFGALIFPTSSLQFNEVDGCWMMTIALYRENATEILNSMKRQELSIFAKSSSTNEWEFELNITQTFLPEKISMGRLKETLSEEINAELPEGYNVYQVEVKLEKEDASQWKHYQLNKNNNEESQARFEKFIENLKKTPEKKLQGNDRYFLATSISGEWTLLKRYEDNLKMLVVQGGFSPFIASYLFEPKKIRTPENLVEIERWYNPNLNEAQKEAVQISISAADFALLQGPPGSGKTTMIAEICSQLVAKGERVLLASQSNTAVDNALERFQDNPAVRIIRLGKKHKIDASLPYQEDKVLQHYCTTIAQEVEKEQVEPVLKRDEILQKIPEWLEIETQFQKNIQSEKERGRILREELHRLQLEKKEAAKIDQENQFRKDSVQSLRLLRDYINADRDSFEIPESLKDELQSVLRVNHQECLQIPQNKFSLPKTPAEMTSVLHHWKTLQEKLERDLNALLSMEPDIELKKELIDKQTQVKELQNLVRKDTKYLDDWRKACDELDELESKKTTIRSKEEYDFFAIAFSDSESIDTNREICEAVLNAISALNPSIEQLKNVLLKWITDEITHRSEDLPLKSPKIEAELAKHKKKMESQERDLQGQKKAHQTHLQTRPILLEEGEKNIRDVYQNMHTQALQEKKDAGREGTLWHQIRQSWIQKLNAEQENDEELLAAYIQLCNIVGVTCTEQTKSIEKKTLPVFDTIIIDEVSKATPLELLMPMMQGRRVILVGDHRQLPPTFTERIPYLQEIDLEQEGTVLTKENVDKFKFLVTASLFKKHFEQASEKIKKMLWIQYRMHPQIMKLVNHFYENRLKCGLKNPERDRAHGLEVKNYDKKTYLRPNQHVLWIDSTTDPSGERYYEGQSDSSKINLLEVKLICQILDDMNEQLKKENRKKDVGIISFYGHQITEIKNEIDKLKQEGKLGHLDISIDTVDLFQGKENAIIFVSLVRHINAKSGKKGAHVTQFERINVAFSRAQELLCIVGAKSFYADIEVELPLIDRDGVNTQKVYQSILQDLHGRGCILPSRDILPSSMRIGKSGKRTENVFTTLCKGDELDISVKLVKDNGVEVVLEDFLSEQTGFILAKHLCQELKNYKKGQMLRGKIFKIDPKKRSILINEVRSAE